MFRAKDLTGQRFGRLTVVERAGTDRSRDALWLCKCDCGGAKTVKGYSLKSGTTSSCGCLQKEVWAKLMVERSKSTKLKLDGTTSGFLTYVGEAPSRGYNRYIVVRCACGKIYECAASQYISGGTKSCGCMRKIVAKDTMVGLHAKGILNPRSGTFRDLSGQKFHYLTVLKEGIRAKDGRVQWECECECGVKKLIPTSSLNKGAVKSCGCKSKELSRQTKERKANEHSK